MIERSGHEAIGLQLALPAAAASHPHSLPPDVLQSRVNRGTMRTCDCIPNRWLTDPEHHADALRRRERQVITRHRTPRLRRVVGVDADVEHLVELLRLDLA